MDWETWWFNFCVVEEKLILQKEFSFLQSIRVYEIMKIAFRAGENYNQSSNQTSEFGM